MIVLVLQYVVQMQPSAMYDIAVVMKWCFVVYEVEGYLCYVSRISKS